MIGGIEPKIMQIPKKIAEFVFCENLWFWNKSSSKSQYAKKKIFSEMIDFHKNQIRQESSPESSKSRFG